MLVHYGADQGNFEGPQEGNDYIPDIGIFMSFIGSSSVNRVCAYVCPGRAAPCGRGGFVGVGFSFNFPARWYASAVQFSQIRMTLMQSG